MPIYLTNLEKDPEIPEKDKEDISKLKALLRQEKALPTDLLNYKHIFRRFAKFHNFNSVSALMNTADFMGIKPYTGLNTINNLLSIANIKIPIDGPITKYTSRFFIARELNMLFRQLRREDRRLSYEDMNEIPEDELDYICYKRGININ